MSRPPYLTAPPPSDRMPGGIPFIVGNEAAERFSYYGMVGILYVFMTKYLVLEDAGGTPYTKEQANTAIALFRATAYFFIAIHCIDPTRIVRRIAVGRFYFATTPRAITRIENITTRSTRHWKRWTIAPSKMRV